MNVEGGRMLEGGAVLEGLVEVLHFREMPFFGAPVVFGTVEDLHGGAEVDGRGDGVVFEDAAETGEGEGFEVSHFVEEAEMALFLDVVDGGLEAGLAPIPVVDGGAVDTGGGRGGSDSATVGEGDGGAGLRGREREQGGELGLLESLGVEGLDGAGSNYGIENGL